VRILFANDGRNDQGGVQTYLGRVMVGLTERGHEVAFLYNGHPEVDAPPELPHFALRKTGLARAVESIRAWRPDVCFSHNMRHLSVERKLLDLMPVVKFMHGYLGTCLSGHKMHDFPRAVPCTRRLGTACFALYVPRRCGSARPNKMIRQLRWAFRQRNLFPRYAVVVVASQHMKEEFVRGGISENKIRVLPLFSVAPIGAQGSADPNPANTPTVLFLGRMTSLKGGDQLIRAVVEVRSRTGQTIRLTMAGDGPQRSRWEDMAKRFAVEAEFTGWVDEGRRRRLLEQSCLLAVPSVWPEPFGLVGLEAASVGVPAVAFDVGGIREWLEDGVNGYLVPADPPSHSALATALIKAIADKDQLRLMGRRAKLVASKMSLASHLEQLEQVLAQAAARRH
jgi:glycosyltransferase involved in cell wall biosynthesis